MQNISNTYLHKNPINLMLKNKQEDILNVSMQFQIFFTSPKIKFQARIFSFALPIVEHLSSGHPPRSGKSVSNQKQIASRIEFPFFAWGEI